MTKRSPFAVFFLSLLTFGIYILVWRVKTKGEMCRLGADIPTAWFLLIPFVSIYWLWKYSGGVEKITNGKYSQAVAFLLLALLPAIGDAVMQEAYNEVNLVSTVGAI